MNDFVLDVVKIGLQTSVIASVFAQGMGIVPSQLALFKERPLLMLRSLGVALLLVPAVTLLIILLLKPAPSVGLGLAILAASPPAPMSLIKIPKKGGSLTYVASLHLSLALLAFLSVPTTLLLFSEALGFQVQVDVSAVGRVVLKTILVPVCLGILVRHFFTEVADRIRPVLARVAEAVLRVLFLLVVVMIARLLLKMDLWSYLVMAVVVGVAVAIGHWLGPDDPEDKTTLAMECASRHAGLAMTIAALNTKAPQMLAVLAPYLIVSMFVTTAYRQWRKRSSPRITAQQQ